MKKTSILYIEFLKDTAANHLLMMIKGMMRYKNYSFVCLCQKKSFLAAELKAIGIRDVYEFDYHLYDKNKFRVFLKNIRYLYLLLYILFKHDINIIHSHRLQWAYVVAILSIILRIPIFIHLVVIEKPVNIVKQFIIKYVSNITFIAVSKNARNQFIQLNSVSPKKVISHYGGIFLPDIKMNQKVQIPALDKLKKKRKIIIGMVSRMDALKGVDVFIEAAGILVKQYPRLHFIHIGNQVRLKNNANYFHTCKSRVLNLNLTDRFTFINYVDNVLPYFKYLYLTALPSYKDTLAYVNIESNAFRVPAISTNIGGIPESVVEKKLCLLPYPPSPLLLAEKISILLNDQNQYKLLRIKVKQNILKNFNSEKNAKQLDAIYKAQFKS